MLRSDSDGTEGALRVSIRPADKEHGARHSAPRTRHVALRRKRASDYPTHTARQRMRDMGISAGPATTTKDYAGCYCLFQGHTMVPEERALLHS